MTSTIAPPQIIAPPMKAAKRRHPLRTVAETIVLLAAATLLLEGAFAAFGVGMEEILEPDPVFGTRHIANKQIVWRMEGYSNERLSSAGLRDSEHQVSKPAGTLRIALLGDSATEGLQVPLSDTYGKVLEQSLTESLKRPVEVINFGCSGYSTGQEVLQFEQQVAQYKPDITILLYNRGDNVENVRKPGDLKAEPRPYFYLDQGKLRQDDEILTVNKKDLAPNTVLDFLRRNSNIYGVLSHANLNLSINEPVYRKVRSLVLKPFKTKKRKTAPLYAPQDGWAVTKELIKRLDADCRQANSQLLVVAFPNVVQDKEFSAQIDSMQTLSKEGGFAFYDLTKTFRWHPEPIKLFLKFHFSTKGHALVADEISKTLAENDLI
jgi:lysophospholipase L1-like esterase